MDEELFSKFKFDPDRVGSLLRELRLSVRESKGVLSDCSCFESPRTRQHHQPTEADSARHRAYYEEHWPEYRHNAIANLHESLQKHVPVITVKLFDGRVIELRPGTYNDADNIGTRDHEFYSVPSLAIGRENSTSFRIASYSASPFDPIGYYFISNYYEDDPHWLHQSHEGQRFVGEAKLAYVSSSERGQHLGAILVALAALEIIDNPDVDVLNFQVANRKVGEYLNHLGFQPTGKANYGYDDYKIDLTKDRAAIRAAFQKYLDMRMGIGETLDR